MKFNPTTIFWVTFAAMCGQGISSGAIHLIGLLPAEYIGPVSGWISLLTFLALAFLSLATGRAGIGTGPYAPPPTAEEVREVASAAGVAVMPKKTGSVEFTYPNKAAQTVQK